MSSSSNVFPERRHLSNVSFSPLSSEVLYVRIRRMSGEEENPRITSSFRQISRRPAGDGGNKNDNHSKFTMTDSQETASVSSQTLQKEQKTSVSQTLTVPDPTPCLKHAAENISRKACNIPSEKINLCNNCSKSMLSYIFLVQDFLDSLAKEIIGSGTPSCLQCARQEVRDSIAKADIIEKPNVEMASIQKHSDHKSNADSKHRKHSDHRSSGSRQKVVTHERRSGVEMCKEKSQYQESHSKQHREESTAASYQSDSNKLKQHQTDFTYNASSSNVVHTETQNIIRESDRNMVITQSNSENKTHQTFETGDDRNQYFTREENQSMNQQCVPESSQNVNQQVVDYQSGWNSSKDESLTNNSTTWQSYGNNYEQHTSSYQQTNVQHHESTEFRTLKERVQPNYHLPPNVPENSSQNDAASNEFESSPSLYREDLDGIISTLSTAEREVYDSARNRAGWESLTEAQEKLVVPSGNLITSEAFVTSCRNNAEAMGCLVLGTSLLLCRTSRTLCVLVSEGVSVAFKSAFSAVFQVVQLVRSLDSLGTTKLALLEQPELGVSFEKLNIWRLVQFTKCVYLNPDTLVIQNCDELFCREELSAVPDIGWPDCFNSGVFVYSPSVQTFWQLLEFAEKQGSYDGGDQGLLNSYFNSWSSDISKKLSFIYNLMANVSYTYSPAFRQFGRDVKIVQFHGSFKPWHVKFFAKTGQISPSSPVHPTYVQFVHIWINIFRITVLRLLSQEIQSYAASQEVISAIEMLRFFPLPSESESEFFLTPPSVRLRLAEMKLNKPANLTISEARRRKSAEVFRDTATEDSIPEIEKTGKEKTEPNIPSESTVKVVVPDEKVIKDDTESKGSESDEVFKENKAIEKEEKLKDDENALPGSEIGDYHGMKAWEQGRMDYEGSARSDNIIKRLQFLMNPKPK